MRRSARNRKTALRTDSGQRKARQGQYWVGQNSLLFQKKKKKAISILDQTSEPTRNAFWLSLDSGADRFGSDPNSGGPCCQFMSAKVTEMLVGASGHRWSCSPSLHSQSKSGFIFFISPDLENERERDRRRMWNCCVKTLVRELLTRTDLGLTPLFGFGKVVYLL